jgi:hypothetical protein
MKSVERAKRDCRPELEPTATRLPVMVAVDASNRIRGRGEGAE